MILVHERMGGTWQGDISGQKRSKLYIPRFGPNCQVMLRRINYGFRGCAGSYEVIVGIVKGHLPRISEMGSFGQRATFRPSKFSGELDLKVPSVLLNGILSVLRSPWVEVPFVKDVVHTSGDIEMLC